MIDEELIWEQVWPVLAAVVEAAMREDETAVAPNLLPGSAAADLLDLFGLTVFDILLKTVLNQDQLNLIQVVDTSEGVFIEFAWVKPMFGQDGAPIDTTVSVLLRMENGRFFVTDVNPGPLDLLLTEARARAILATSKLLGQRDELPLEPWILPLALFGGLLPLPLRPDSLGDPVETLFLPGLQQRERGVMALVRARRLWRDFKAVQSLPTGSLAVWAAAVEWLMNEQNSQQVAATAVAHLYNVSPVKLNDHARQIKQALGITGIDYRYADWQMIDVLYQDES